MNLLLGGSYNMLKCALPYLRKSKAPRVIFMTTVNCIEKGAIERIRHNGPQHGPAFKDTSAFLPYIPQGRMGTPEDLAGAVCYLASEESAYMTGAVLDLSGGLSLV